MILFLNGRAPVVGSTPVVKGEIGYFASTTAVMRLARRPEETRVWKSMLKINSNEICNLRKPSKRNELT